MAITVASNFEVKANLPVDSRYQADTIELRNAIPAGVRYDGLQVYVKEDETVYILKGGIENTNWETLTNGPIRHGEVDGSVVLGTPDNGSVSASQDAISAGHDSIAYSQNSVAMGHGAQAGSKGFKILSILTDSDSGSIVENTSCTTHIFLLSSVDDIEQGSTVTITQSPSITKSGTFYGFHDTIPNAVIINTDTEYKFTLSGDSDDPDNFVMCNYMTIDGRPDLGDTFVSFNSFAFGKACVAQGQNSIATGDATNALGYDSHSEGIENTALGNYSHAEGQQNDAVGQASHAEGNNTSAIGKYSHSEGKNSEASGQASHAEGQNATAEGSSSHAEGNGTEAVGMSSHAEGKSTEAFGAYSHAEGRDTYAEGVTSHTEGLQTLAEGDSSHAEGYYSEAIGDYSHAEGWNTGAKGESSHSEGEMTQAIGGRSHAEGLSTVAGMKGYYYASMEVAEDEKTAVFTLTDNQDMEVNPDVVCEYEVGDKVSIVNAAIYTDCAKIKSIDGNRVTVSPVPFKIIVGMPYLNNSDYSFYCLNNPTTGIVSLGSSAHAEGEETAAYGLASHAEGKGTAASANYSHAEGNNTTAEGLASHAEGYQSDAIGNYSHAEGSSTEAIGSSSHAEGRRTVAEGGDSHAEGFQTEAIGESSHAEGTYTLAEGSESHAEGYETEAIGYSSHAEGEGTQAIGYASHAEGLGTIATADSQHVQGRFNIEDVDKNYAHIVGNGSEDVPSNAHTLDWDGNAWFAGDISVGENNNKLVKMNGVTLSDDAIALGSSTISAGIKCYYFSDIVFNEDGSAIITLTDNQNLIENPDIVCEYEEGDIISIFNSGLYANCSEITSIEGNKITVDSLPFYTFLPGGEPDKYTYTVFVILKPTIGVASIDNPAYVIGDGAVSAGFHSIAEGGFTAALDEYAHAEGMQTVASERYTHAEGKETLASGIGAHAEGGITVASGSYSHAEGRDSLSYGMTSHAEGYKTESIGGYSHAEGRETLAEGTTSHAEGYKTEAIGDYSHAEGHFAEAIGDYSHAEGWNTGANGDSSHSEGEGTHAIGDRSHAEGLSTVAGMKGYYYAAIEISEDKKTATFTLTDNQENVINPDVVCEYEVGDKVSIVNVVDYIDCAKIKSIDGNRVTVSPVPFEVIISLPYLNASDYSFYSFDNPTTGIINLGSSSHAEGDESVAYGLASHAEGKETEATGKYSHSEGESTTASGVRSHAEGYQTDAIGQASHAEGSTTEATGSCSHAEGRRTLSEGGDSHAEGYATEAIGESAHAEGSYTLAEGEESHAEGYETQAIGYSSHAEGEGSQAIGKVSHAEGENTQALGDRSHAEGSGTVAGLKGYYYASMEVAEDGKSATFALTDNQENVINPDVVCEYEVGDTVTIVNAATCMECATIQSIDGNMVTISPVPFTNIVGMPYLRDIDYSFYSPNKPNIGAIGLGHNTHTEGENSIALGQTSHAEGYASKTYGNYSHAEGEETIAHAQGSHSEGYMTEAYGQNSHVEGSGSITEGSSSHAEGSDTEATGSNSHAEGRKAMADGRASHAEGESTEAYGNCSHAEGKKTLAEGTMSHAEGYFTEAIGDYSHAEGWNTGADGEASHSEGEATQAIGDRTHAEGLNTIAGIKGYYYASMEISEDGKSATFTLTDNQDMEINPDIGVEYQTGYTVTIVNGPTYINCASIQSIDGNRVTVSPVPFTRIQEIDEPTVNDYSFYCLELPTVGIINLGPNAHAEGEETVAAGITSHAEGYITKAHGPYSHAEGHTTEAWDNAHAEGNCTTAYGQYSHAEGKNSEAIGKSSHVEGQNSTAEGSSSHAEGYKTEAIGDYSHAEGSNNEAIGKYSHAEGRNTEAVGQASHTEGSNTVADGDYSHAEGANSYACGTNSHAEGYYTEAGVLGYYYASMEVAEDGNSATFTLTDNQYMEINPDIDIEYDEGDIVTIVNGSVYINCTTIQSIDGNRVTVSPVPFTEIVEVQYPTTEDYSFYCLDAPDFGVINLGSNSHAEGRNTLASGLSAHSEGYTTKACGAYSHAEGNHTIATADSQHVQGRFNIEDVDKNYAHIVGNGSEDVPSNAHTLDWDGNAWFAGTVETSGINLRATDGSVTDILSLLSGTVLWENNNVNEAMGKTTINRDLSPYKRFNVLFRLTSTTNINGSDKNLHQEEMFTEKDIVYTVHEKIEDTTTYPDSIYSRHISFADTGITISDAKGDSDAYSSDILKPIKIIGYRY